MRERIANEIRLLAGPIGLNNTATIKFNNRQDAQSSLGVLRANDNIDVAALLYADSSVFVEYFRGDVSIPYKIPENIIHEFLFQEDHIEVFQRIEVDNMLFGFIYIRSNLEDLRILRNNNIKISLIAILASTIFALLVALALSWPISTPVKRLANLANEIKDNNDFSRRIKRVKGKSELAQLYKAFNEMLGQIEAQNLELKTAFDFAQMQKDEINQKNLDITDSINSARRLQKIILPQMRTVKRIVQDVFVFFKPKDILSGDFYWFSQKDNWSFFAAVDCVGHGVPGALLSIVANSWLQKIVVEREVFDPGEILTHLDKVVTHNLKGEMGSARSMDMAFVAINFHTLELRFAGAYNPLYVIRGKELFEFKADRIAIGTLKDYQKSSFTSRRFKLQKDDMIYLFSDGFADQFGGHSNKKFKYKPFRQLLTDISHLSTEEQEERLEETFQRWRGTNEQVDDVIVMGIRTPARVTEPLPLKHR